MQEKSGIVYLTADEMRKIDERAIREFQIDVLVLMENAGRAVATLAKRMLSRTPGRVRVACLVGGGNNGGDGLVAARHLANWDIAVDTIVSTTKDKVRQVPLAQLQTLEKMGLPIIWGQYNLAEYDLLVDGLIGYGLEGDPRDRTATIIRDANRSGRPVLAIDLPSGMNATTGKLYDPCIKATSTLTLALPKTGFLDSATRPLLGELYLADISIPGKIYKAWGQKTALFQRDVIVKL